MCVCVCVIQVERAGENDSFRVMERNSPKNEAATF